MLIDEARLQKSLTFLAETDEQVAEARADLERYEFKAKATKDAIFLRSEGSVAERNATAGTAAEYIGAMDTYFEALKRYESLRNRRAKEVIVIDCWRSLSSARTKGIVL